MKRIVSIILIILLLSTPIFANSFMTDSEFKQQLESIVSDYKNLDSEAVFWAFIANTNLTTEQIFATQYTLLNCILESNSSRAIESNRAWDELLYTSIAREKHFNFEYFSITSGWKITSSLDPIFLWATISTLLFDEVHDVGWMFDFVIDKYKEHKDKYGEELFLASEPIDMSIVETAKEIWEFKYR